MAVSTLGAHARSLLREALQLFWTLLKILVPLSLAVRLLTQLGVVQRLGRALGPVMHAAGLLRFCLTGYTEPDPRSWEGPGT